MWEALVETQEPLVICGQSFDEAIVPEKLF